MWDYCSHFPKFTSIDVPAFRFQVTFSSCCSPVVKRTCFLLSDLSDQVSRERQVQALIPADEEAKEKPPLLTSCGT